MRLVGSLTAMTGRHVLEGQRRPQTFYDSLSGLANQVVFMGRLSRTLAVAEGRGRLQFCRARFDVDNFNEMNDNLRYLAGDEPLVESSRRAGQVGAFETLPALAATVFAVPIIDVRRRRQFRRACPRRLGKSVQR